MSSGRIGVVAALGLCSTALAGVPWHVVEVAPGEGVELSHEATEWGLKVTARNTTRQTATVQCALTLEYQSSSREDSVKVEHTFDVRAGATLTEVINRGPGLAKMRGWTGDCTLAPLEPVHTLDCPGKEPEQIRQVEFITRGVEVYGLRWESSTGQRTTLNRATLESRLDRLQKSQRKRGDAQAPAVATWTSGGKQYEVTPSVLLALLCEATTVSNAAKASSSLIEWAARRLIANRTEAFEALKKRCETDPARAECEVLKQPKTINIGPGKRD